LKLLSLTNRYTSLGDGFYTRNQPTPVANPSFIKFNNELATDLGLGVDELNSLKGLEIFSGNKIPEGAEPLAMAYAGHQFGHFNPQLGDGRAVYLGEITSASGESVDIQLKGSGPTYYSRNGDGRSALGPVLREYLVSEAMFKLNVPTTRALAAVSSGEEVARERLTPGGVFTRIATSFIRVGSFEFFAARRDVEDLKKLADYVIERNYPAARESENPYLAFLKSVVERQASLIAKWMQLGFIHGVMNTDNMSVVGETIDYGPCAFIDDYDHKQVFSSIDRDGRYAYSNQPSIGLWNLTRLAESIVPLLAIDTDEAVKLAQETLKSYIDSYEAAWLSGMRAKFGLSTSAGGANDDKVLIENLFDIMHESRADFTLCFFHLSRMAIKPSAVDTEIRNLFDNDEAFDVWLQKWRKRLSQEDVSDADRQHNMQAVNPVYIPRNHQIEAAIRAAEDNNDFSVFHDLHEVLQNPFTLQDGKEAYMQTPKPNEVVLQTFCGT